MITRKIVFLVLFLLALSLLVRPGVSADQVVVRFLFWDPASDSRYCATCQTWISMRQDFLQKNETMKRIETDYGSRVFFDWINATEEGGSYNKTLLQSYNVSSPNSLTINSDFQIERAFNETFIRDAIDAAVEGSSVSPISDLTPMAALAFSFGFFETFSPCLLALLSFVLSFTVGETTRFRQSFLQIMLFGVGFISAAVLIGVSFGLLFVSLQAYQATFTLVVCVFALLFGFNLLGVFKIPLETKPLLQKITKKFVFSFGGLVLLGFLFYFLDPCIAPFFFAMLPVLSGEGLPLIILFFCLGVMVPFFLIAIVAGSISKLVRITYKNKSKIRFVSGLILIVYTLYIIFFRLL